MQHETALIAILTSGLGLAFIFGFLAARLSLPPLVGYLLAGVAVGPCTPGFVADAGLASQLAEIGMILLMFGVGLHFSPRDLMGLRAHSDAERAYMEERKVGKAVMGEQELADAPARYALGRFGAAR